MKRGIIITRCAIDSMRVIIAARITREIKEVVMGG